MRNYIKRCGSEAVRWFKITRPFWFWLGLAVIVVVITYRLPAELTNRVRWAGTAFEFFGVTAVLVGVERARRSFGRPSIVKGLALAIGEFRYIFWQRPPIMASLSASTGMAIGSSASATVVRATGTVEERLTRLEQESTEIQRDVGKLYNKLDQQKKEMQAQISLEIAERKANDEKVKQRLEEGIVGDNNLEIAGVGFLYLGLLLANLSSDVASVLVKIGFN
jgi:hypothetical protein